MTTRGIWDNSVALGNAHSIIQHVVGLPLENCLRIPVPCSGKSGDLIADKQRGRKGVAKNALNEISSSPLIEYQPRQIYLYQLLC